MLNIFFIMNALEKIFCKSKYNNCKAIATKKEIYGVMNSECLVKPKDNCPILIKRVIKTKFIIEISIANFNDLEFLYRIEIFISLINLLYMVKKHSKNIRIEVKRVNILIFEY